MSASANPDIVDDGLVFLYDTDDGKSYKGEPTTNLISGVANPNLSISGWYSNGWNGSISVDTDEGALVLNATNGWRSMSYDFGVTNGTVTVQFDYKLKSAEHTNIYMVVLNGTHLGSYTQYLDGSLYPSLTEYKTYKKTFTTTTDSKICIVLRGTDNAGLTDEMFVKNLQVEQKSHATPFVNGTRSATQGLLDRTGNSTIDISNASFDSNAQMTFDGTDDDIDVGTGTSTSYQRTIEMVFKTNSLTSYTPLACYTRGGGQSVVSGKRMWLGFQSNKFQMHGWGTNDPASTTTIQTGKYYHAVYAYDQTTKKHYIWINGSLENNATNDQSGFTGWNSSGDHKWFVGGDPDHASWFASAGRSLNGEIPIFKVYDKILSNEEVLQNYNAIKSRFGL